LCITFLCYNDIKNNNLLKTKRLELFPFLLCEHLQLKIKGTNKSHENLFKKSSPNFCSIVPGPYEEGTELEVSCEAGGGARPAPSLTWLLNGEEWAEGVREEEEEEGLSRSHITLSLDRSHLGAILTCRYTSQP
jgi:hypothetical protein